jgi:hypothetical protein
LKDGRVMFPRILVAIDGFQSSTNAKNYVLSNAVKYNSQLTLLYGIPLETKLGHAFGMLGVVVLK